MAKDVLGRDMTPTEEKMLSLYNQVKELLEQKDLPPLAEANLRFALAHLWQIVNGLDLAYEQLYEYGV